MSVHLSNLFGTPCLAQQNQLVPSPSPTLTKFNSYVHSIKLALAHAKEGGGEGGGGGWGVYHMQLAAGHNLPIKMLQLQPKPAAKSSNVVVISESNQDDLLQDPPPVLQILWCERIAIGAGVKALSTNMMGLQGAEIGHAMVLSE